MEELILSTPSMMEGTKGQDLVFEVEAFLEEGFEFLGYAFCRRSPRGSVY